VGVDVDVIGELVHRLADADARREVDHAVDALECSAEGIDVAHVADLQLRIGAQVVGTITAVVHLPDQRVQHAHPIPAFEQLAGEMRSDESCATGDENRFHRPLSSRVE
jgi:hypothetical protein